MNKFAVFLIIVAVIIGIGAILKVLNPMREFAKAQDKIRIQDMKKISQALEQYRNDYGTYPHYDTKQYIIVIDDEKKPWGVSWMPYLKKIPQDLDPKRRYVYWSDAENGYQEYRLYTSLQSPIDADGACSKKGECANVPGKNLCGENAPCNFGITSGNITP